MKPITNGINNPMRFDLNVKAIKGNNRISNTKKNSDNLLANVGTSDNKI